MTIADDSSHAQGRDVPVRVAVYASAATVAQACAGTSLGDQLERLNKAGIQRGWTVVAEFKDMGTRSRARTGLEKMLDAAAERPRHFDKVLIQNSTALSRDTVLAMNWIQKFDDIGAPIMMVDSAEDDNQGWLMRRVIAMCNEQSSKEHSKRVKRGIAAARARRAAATVGETKQTKVPCQHCAGRGWAETAVSSADVSEPAVED